MVLNSAQAYQDLYDFLLGQAGVEPGPVGEPKRKPRVRAKSLVFGGEGGGPGHPAVLDHSNLQARPLAKVDSGAREGAGRNDDQGHTITTAGGFYSGGNVHVGDNSVGRDQVITIGERAVIIGGNANGNTLVTGNGNVISQSSPATLQDLRALLAELGRLLPQAGLPADIAPIIEADYQIVKDQADQEKPHPVVLKSKLKGLLELLTSSGNVAGALEKILTVGGKAVQMANVLFP